VEPSKILVAEVHCLLNIIIHFLDGYVFLLFVRNPIILNVSKFDIR